MDVNLAMFDSQPWNWNPFAGEHPKAPSPLKQKPSIKFQRNTQVLYVDGQWAQTYKATIGNIVIIITVQHHEVAEKVAFYKDDGMIINHWKGGRCSACKGTYWGSCSCDY